MPDRNPVYDGREMIGETRRLGPHEFEAFSVAGRKLGLFASMAEATHAVRATTSRSDRN